MNWEKTKVLSFPSKTLRYLTSSSILADLTAGAAGSSGSTKAVSSGGNAKRDAVVTECRQNGQMVSRRSHSLIQGAQSGVQLNWSPGGAKSLTGMTAVGDVGYIHRGAEANLA